MAESIIIENTISASTIIKPDIEILTIIEDKTVATTIVKPDIEILTIIEDTVITMNIIDTGIQGLSGANGKSLTYNDLTNEQKLELQDGIVNITTNYTNIFLNTLIGE